MRAVVPIGNLDRRLPTLGRIRIGVKVAGTKKNGDKYERPSSIDTFRLTSHDQAALEQVAKLYGGTVKPWNEPRADPNQFEVVTSASELRVVLPPDPLGNTPVYERWTGGGCDRRCTGVTCTQIVKGPEGAEPVDVPCLCVAQNKMVCDPHTRLSVILPEIRFGGVWRLDSKGWDAAQELPGMVYLLQSMQERGLTVGLLRLEQRRKVVAGETRNFPVPVLALDASMDELAAGAARFSVGAGSSAPALGPGSSAGALPSAAEERPPTAPGHAPTDRLDDDVVDAVVVEDRPAPGERACTRCQGSLAGAPVERDGSGYAHKECPTPTATQAEQTGITDLDIHKLAAKVFDRARQDAPRGRKTKVVDDCRHAVAFALTKQRAWSLNDLTPEEKYRLHSELGLLDTGFNSWSLTDDSLVIEHNGQQVTLPFVELEPAS